MSVKYSGYLVALAMAVTITGCSTNKSKPAEESTDTTSTSEQAPAAIESTEASSSDGSLLSQKVFYFDFDKSDIRPEGEEALKAHAAHLAGNADAKVRLEGHADERGTREYNMALGERRGVAVSKFLRASGVSDAQIEVVSYGEEKPVSFGHDDSSWQQNRRVELNYTAGQP